jgi:hypothetical protein
VKAPILRKIKAIAIGAAVMLLGGLGTYLTTDVDWAAAFGPGVGGVVSVAIGFAVKEGFSRLIAYLKASDEVVEVSIEEVK